MTAELVDDIAPASFVTGNGTTKTIYFTILELNMIGFYVRLTHLRCGMLISVIRKIEGAFSLLLGCACVC